MIILLMIYLLLYYAAIQRMASPYVTVNPDALDSNILLVNINSTVVDAKYFVSELIKVVKSVCL
jgi:hypothetical protein